MAHLASGIGAGVAVGLDLALFTTLSDASDQVGWAGPDAAPALILGAGLGLLPVLLLRRRAPVRVCLVLAGYAVLLTATLGSRPLVTLLVALYAAAVWAPKRRAVLALGAVLGAHVVAVAYEASFAGAGLSPFDVLAVGLVYLGLDTATFAAGRWGASAAARRRARVLVEQQEAETAQAVATERRRIARELHDLVAHAVTLMVLQSAGARRLNGRDPERAAEAMGAVEQLGQQAVVELRQLLELLRADDPPADEPGADRPGADGPGTGGRLPGLDDLDGLLWPAQAAGIAIDVRHRGTARPLDPATDLTAYRFVQEALTNVTKHAGPGCTAVLTLDWRSDTLVIELIDDGPSATAVSVPHPLRSGYGLVGVAERVKLAEGRLEAGPRSDQQGYAVRVRLPTGGAAAPAPPTPVLV